MRNQENKKRMNANVCSITGKKYYGCGNNAWPFEGRCSDSADLRYVIPARLAGVTPEVISHYGKEKILSILDGYKKGMICDKLPEAGLL